MTVKCRLLAVTTALMVLGIGGSVEGFAQATGEPPAGVTDEIVAGGKSLFEGAALCFACHGLEGTGGIGPDLTDDISLQELKSFEALVTLITLGVNETNSVTGQIMPAKGGSGISRDEVRAVAAYVWTLSSARPPM